MVAGEKKADLFAWLVQYHCQTNLARCIPYMNVDDVYTGKVHLHGEPLDERRPELRVEGFRPGLENELYTGALIVSNGTTLVDKLNQGEVIHDEVDDLDFIDAAAKEAFFSYLASQHGNDGAHLYDGVNRKIAHVPEFNNNPATLREKVPLYLMVPADFMSTDESVSPRKMGVKTRLAIRLPQAYDTTNTFQIKRTPYANTGMGKVTHFDKDGLRQEFHFEYQPESEGPFIDEEHRIAGVHRIYARNEDGELIKTSERLVGNPTEYFARNQAELRQRPSEQRIHLSLQNIE